MPISISAAQTNQTERSAFQRGDTFALLTSRSECSESASSAGKSLSSDLCDVLDMQHHSFMTNSRPDCEPT